MSGRIDDAGLLPAFMEYRQLGARYERLIEQFRSGMHVHAYLFAGPVGIGKKMLARYLATVLLCQSDLPPCGDCGQCRQVSTGKHSSVIEISPEGSKSISVDRIRDLIALTSMHSLDNRERIIIIEPMEALTPQAQNCLLKTLEEPNTNVVYFLLSHDTSSLLDTILSRCSMFKLTPWPNEVLSHHLVRRGYNRENAEQAALLSGGNVGEALALLDEQENSGPKAALNQILSVSNARDAVRCSAMLKDNAGNADQILRLLEQYLQQCMLVNAGIISQHVLLKSPWTSMVQNASIHELANLTDLIFHARKLRMSNVNWQSNMDQLIWKLLEATNKWQKS